MLLKPCPFCGASGGLSIIDYPPEALIKCAYCEMVVGSCSKNSTKEELIDKWNTRGETGSLKCPFCGGRVAYTEHYDRECFNMPWYTYSHPKKCPCIRAWDSKARLTVNEQDLKESWAKFCEEIKRDGYTDDPEEDEQEAS